MVANLWFGQLETERQQGLLPTSLFSLGVPFFTVEPKDLAVLPNAPFQLSCEAVGPPEPVTIIWWRGGTKVGGPAPSPSVLNVTGEQPLEGALSRGSVAGRVQICLKHGLLLCVQNKLWCLGI